MQNDLRRFSNAVKAMKAAKNTKFRLYWYNVAESLFDRAAEALNSELYNNGVNKV